MRFKTLKGEIYESPSDWKDVSFEFFLSYFDKVGNKEPKELSIFTSEHFEAVSKIKETWSEERKLKEANRLFNERWAKIQDKDKAPIYDYFALEVGFWCGKTKEQVLNDLSPETLESAFWGIQYEMNPDNAAVNEDYTGFEIKGVEYLCPEKHMIGSTVVEFLESAQYQHMNAAVQGGQWKAMRDILVVLCKPKGEKYDNTNKARNEARKQLFKTLPMSDVINVGFFLHRLNDSLRTNIAIFTAQRELARRGANSSISVTDGQQSSMK